MITRPRLKNITDPQNPNSGDNERWDKKQYNTGADSNYGDWGEDKSATEKEYQWDKDEKKTINIR